MLNSVFGKKCLEHKLLLRKQCSCGTAPLLATSQSNARWCQHKDPEVSSSANFSSTERKIMHALGSFDSSMYEGEGGGVGWEGGGELVNVVYNSQSTGKVI